MWAVPCSIAAYEKRAEDRQRTPMRFVVYLPCGPPPAPPCRHYGWNRRESPGRRRCLVS